MPQNSSAAPLGLAKEELAQRRLEQAASRIADIDSQMEGLRQDRATQQEIIEQASKDLIGLIEHGKSAIDGPPNTMPASGPAY